MNVDLNDLRKEFGELTAVKDVSLQIKDGEFITFVGPSGCGKTTTLRMIAGLETPTSGNIHFDNKDVTDDSPQARGVALVFQDYALYPHMTAKENMSFALKDKGELSKTEIQEHVEETARMLGIADHLSKVPSDLSGGQQQRVALGRSIVRDPNVFLLDEPLSNLDAKLRNEMRTELQELHQELKTTMVYVTHDQEEALTMSDRLVVMNEGEVQQVDEPSKAYDEPKNRFVAGFLGNPSMNFFKCHMSNGKVEAGPFSLPLSADIPKDAAELGIRPEHMMLQEASDAVRGTVDVFERLGSYNLAYLTLEDGNEVVVQVPAENEFVPGDNVPVTIMKNKIHLFAEDGKSLPVDDIDKKKSEQVNDD